MKQAAKGTKITVSTTEVGSLTSISGLALSAETTDVTSLDSADGYREYVGGLKDGGDASVSGFYDNADAGQTALHTAFEAGEPVPCVITFPKGGSWTFNAIVTGYETGAELEGVVSFDASFKVTGKPTLAAGAGA